MKNGIDLQFQSHTLVVCEYVIGSLKIKKLDTFGRKRGKKGADFNRLIHMIKGRREESKTQNPKSRFLLLPSV